MPMDTAQSLGDDTHAVVKLLSVRESTDGAEVWSILSVGGEPAEKKGSNKDAGRSDCNTRIFVTAGSPWPSLSSCLPSVQSGGCQTWVCIGRFRGVYNCRGCRCSHWRASAG